MSHDMPGPGIAYAAHLCCRQHDDSWVNGVGAPVMRRLVVLDESAVSDRIPAGGRLGQGELPDVQEIIGECRASAGSVSQAVAQLAICPVLIVTAVIEWYGRGDRRAITQAWRGWPGGTACRADTRRKSCEGFKA